MHTVCKGCANAAMRPADGDDEQALGQTLGGMRQRFRRMCSSKIAMESIITA